MSFDSTTFMVFMAVVFAIHWFSHSAHQQNVFLLLASLIFYGWFDWRCLGLMVAMVAWTYLFGMALGLRKSRPVLTLAILGPVATLAFFKYFNFFIESIEGIFSIVHLHLQPSPLSTLSIILPIGISFYTFMAISYLVDVFKDKLPPERNLLDFAAYMVFFPQLVAGPIGRAPEMLLQFKSRRVFDEGLAAEACRQILWGAFAKFVVADNCNTIASTLLGCSQLSRGMVVTGALAYTIQIYGDFAGYSNMAVGLGKLFGIRLKQNFAYPYFATSFSDFWRRWHISLTTWFRDYVYFPLGGSRCSLAKTIRNTWIVFLLSGLWHGAAWTFVAWGGLHALFLMGGVIRKHFGRTSVGVPLLSWLIVMAGVAFAWLLFQAPDFASVGNYAQSLAFSCPAAIWPKVPMTVYAISAIGMLLLLGWEWMAYRGGVEFGLCIVPSARVLRWTAYIVITLMVVCCGGDGGSFIYQKF